MGGALEPARGPPRETKVMPLCVCEAEGRAGKGCIYAMMRLKQRAEACWLMIMNAHALYLLAPPLIKERSEKNAAM